MDASGENNEVMTLTEVAKYLQLAERTVLRMAQRGEIPAAKVASQWRFMRLLIRDWLVGQMQTIAPTETVGNDRLGQTLLPLGEVLHPELMMFDIKPGPKENILRQLSAPLLETGFVQDPSRFLNSLVERERMMTTAIGHGIAIPHPRRPINGMFSEPAIALGICPKGTNFQAIDDQLVHVFFLICATREEIHLQLMANVSWAARQEGTIAKLGQASSPQEITTIVMECPPGS